VKHDESLKLICQIIVPAACLCPIGLVASPGRTKGTGPQKEQVAPGRMSVALQD
jgi:hypothetical protein